MYPYQHTILGILFGILLFLISPNYFGIVGAIIVAASSVLIDVDHYLFYVYKKKDWSLRNARKWYLSLENKTSSWTRSKINTTYSGWFFLHGIEILLVLFLLGFFINKFFLFIMIGFTFHLILDWFTENIYHDRLDKISVIYDFVKFRKMKFIDSGDNF